MYPPLKWREINATQYQQFSLTDEANLFPNINLNVKYYGYMIRNGKELRRPEKVFFGQSEDVIL